MLEFQQRVVDEKAALDEKIAKLAAFYDSPRFRPVNPTEQWRLTTQLHMMVSYSAILGERIAAFTP